MSFDFKLSPEFSRDLSKIEEYVKANQFKEGADHTIVSGILSQVQKLASNGEAWQRYFLPDGTPTVYRHILYSYSSKVKYEIFYRIDGDTIFVDRVLSTRADYMRSLFVKNFSKEYSDSTSEY